MLSEMKPSKALRQFQKLYWDDLTPEQINYIGQSIGEVAQLEAELEQLKKIISECPECDEGS